MNKQFKICLVILIIAFIVSVSTFSFAYLGKRLSTVNNSTVSGEVDDSDDYVTLTYPTSTNLNLSVDIDTLASDVTSSLTAAASTSSDITMTLTTTGNYYTNGMTCYYSLYYTPTVAFTSSYDNSITTLTELSLKAYSTLNSVTQTTLDEFKIENKTAGTKYFIGQSTISNASGASSTSLIWHISLNFYNLSVNQSSAIGQNPTGIFSIETDRCEAN